MQQLSCAAPARDSWDVVKPKKRRTNELNHERRKTMPNINSFADLVLDQEQLLRAFEDNSEALAIALPQRNAVASNLIQLHEVKGRQESFAAQRQEATQNLEFLMQQTRED